MGHQRNTIPDQEYFNRLKVLMDRLLTYHNPDKETNKEMFFLYNDQLTPREQGSTCGRCQARVFNRLKKHWEELNK